MGNKCPKCGATKGFSDVTGTYNTQSGAVGAGLGALGGFLIGGPIGLMVGAGLGTLSGKPKSNSCAREYKCDNCGKRFEICPKCFGNTNIKEYNNLQPKSGYITMKGKQCGDCGTIIKSSYYVKKVDSAYKSSNSDYDDDYDY